MSSNQNILDDFMNIGGGLLQSVVAARGDIKSKMKERMNGALGQLDLITRDEFDTAFAILQNSRMIQEDILERIAVIERKLGITLTKSNDKKKFVNKKARLPSVKKSSKRRRA
jgi:BMFP domain-containing protein YqiC